jgi:small subunit ribosomal protein S5
MAEMIEESQALESTTVNLWRNSKVVKGGRRFSLSALVVVGDRRGTVGVGYGKATGAPMAIEKAQKNARKNLVRVSLKGGTLPHPVDGRYSASIVRLIPASPGTGVIAGGTVRAVLEMAGVHDCLTKSYGSNNQKNLVKAAMQGLLHLRTKADIGRLRGVELDETDVEKKLEVGRRYAPSQASGEKAQAPVNVVGQKGGRGGGGRRRGGGGGGRGGNRGGGQPQYQPQAPAAQPQAETPAEAPAPSDAPAAGGEEQTQS